MRISGSKAAQMQPLVWCDAVKTADHGSNLACHAYFSAGFHGEACAKPMTSTKALEANETQTELWSEYQTDVMTERWILTILAGDRREIGVQSRNRHAVTLPFSVTHAREGG